MILWTREGPIVRPPEQEVEKEFEKVKEKIAAGGYVTIRQFYTLIGLPYEESAKWISSNPEFYGEFFVNPDAWGWDEKGFRKLFETIVERKRL